MNVLILGASLNPERYSYQALNDLLDNGHEVFAIGNREGEHRGVHIVKSTEIKTEINTVTLYLGAKNQPMYYDLILQLSPKRVIFNPGTENPELYSLLEEKNIEVLSACTLVMLRTNQF